MILGKCSEGDMSEMWLLTWRDTKKVMRFKMYYLLGRTRKEILRSADRDQL